MVKTLSRNHTYECFSSFLSSSFFKFLFLPLSYSVVAMISRHSLCQYFHCTLAFTSVIRLHFHPSCALPFLFVTGKFFVGLTYSAAFHHLDPPTSTICSPFHLTIRICRPQVCRNNKVKI